MKQSHLRDIRRGLADTVSFDMIEDRWGHVSITASCCNSDGTTRSTTESNLSCPKDIAKAKKRLTTQLVALAFV